MWEGYTIEDLKRLLAQSEERLKRFLELNAPAQIVEKERKLIREKKEAIRRLEN